MVFTQGPSAHLRSLATEVDLGTIPLIQTRSLRLGRCRKNLPLYAPSRYGAVQT